MDSGIVKYFLRKRRENDPNLQEKNIVILHQFERALYTPSVSAFALKLETWLRMAQIEYKNHFTIEKSPKGKIPWITYNGEHISDSQFCIDYLIKKFDKDLSEHLTPEEKSLARAYLKLTEESIRWVGVIFRFKYGKPEDLGMAPFIFNVVGGKMLNETLSQGYGHHSEDELYEIGIADLKALNIFIGNKKFLMGDNPCNEDASIFGILAQSVYNSKGRLNDYVMKECNNIVRFVETMKTKFWADWDEQLRKTKDNLV